MATASISASNTQYFHTIAGESINVAGNNGNSGSGTEYIDIAYGHATGLGSSNTDYLYAITATNELGSSILSESVSAQTTVESSILAAATPQNITADILNT